MNKSNREAARQQRAREREKEAQKKQLIHWLKIILPILCVIILVIVMIVDHVNQKAREKAAREAAAAAAVELRADTALTVANGDEINLDYVGSVDGVEFDGGNTHGNGTTLVIGSGRYIDDFEEQLIGHHVGETVNVYATFPENYGQDMLNGKEALFVTTINGIYLSQTDLDARLAAADETAAGNVTTEAEPGTATVSE